MISCKTIIGTVIIEIEKGIGLGEIHQVLVDEGVLLTFVVKSKHSNQPYALLPGKNIYGIGDFAAMVENSSALQEIDETELQALNEQQGGIFDEMVITIDGNKIGRVVDYHIDQKNEIGFLIVSPDDNGEDIQIPKSQILMIGKEYIILNEEKNLETQPVAKPAFKAPDLPLQAPVAEVPTHAPVEELVVEPAPVAQEEVSTEPAGLEDEFDLDAALAQLYTQPSVEEPAKEEVAIESAPLVEEPVVETLVEEKPEPTSSKMSLEEAFATVEPVAATAPEVEEAEEEKPETSAHSRVVPINVLTNEGSSFLNEQKRLLLGKKLQKNLVSTDGNIILFAGDTVTDETIDLLRRIDRKLLVRLAECVV